MALYMNGQEVSQSSGVPIVVEGLTEIDSTTPTSLNGILKGNGSTVQTATAGTDYMTPPASATVLPDSGTALTANTIYNISSPVGVYVFTPPTSGWAHGIFSTSDGAVSFSGQFLGDVPAIEPESVYEFDVYDGVWVVQAVVSA